jgi:dCMP deaminase
MNNRMKNFYMSIAYQCANMSRAIRLRVGAVIVKNNNIISFSWNGTPSGWDNNCEDKEWCDGGG